MKKPVTKFFTFSITGLILVGLFVMIFDPFYHYHTPWFGREAYLSEAVYQTPGAARNLEYDSVILGSSMTENFRASWFDNELGWNTLKLSYAGLRTNDMNAILGQIFKRDRQVSNILIDINDFQLSEPYDSYFAKRPKHLYDSNPFNDVKYLWNKDVIEWAIEDIIAELNGAGKCFDESYLWEPDLDVFGKEHVLTSFLEVEENERKRVNVTEVSLEEILETAHRNLENITPFIIANPDTKFIFFYPPYSLAYWQGLVERGVLKEKIAMYEFSIEYLLKFDNVEIYYFQDMLEIISDLNNYRDICHHTAEINRFIFENIRDGMNRLNADNFKEKLAGMYELALGFDYDLIWN